MIGSYYWNYNREEWDDMSPVHPDGSEKCLSYCPMDVISRPYPLWTNGELIEFGFKRKEKEFYMRFKSSGGNLPTVIYVPSRHFGENPIFSIEGGINEYEFSSQLFYLKAYEKKEYSIRIKSQ